MGKFTMEYQFYKPLTKHPHAQCGVRSINGGREGTFVSYDADVLQWDRMDDGTLCIKVHGWYSVTTARQIGWFIQEYFPRALRAVEILKASQLGTWVAIPEYDD